MKPALASAVVAPLLALSGTALWAVEAPRPTDDAAAAETTGRPDPTEAEMRAWIEQLGADDYGVREAASRKLAEAGERAVPLLAAVHSENPEVQARVRQLLEGGSDERQFLAADRLRKLRTIENLWHFRDDDRNRTADYWTRDLAGLRCIRPAGDDKIAGLVNLAWARADGAPARAYPELDGAPVPRDGYLYKALKTDPDGKPYVEPDLPAPQAANAPEGSCTNRLRYAFCAWPVRHGRDGRLSYVMAEDGVVWQKDLGPGAKGVDAWPGPEKPGSVWAKAPPRPRIEAGQEPTARFGGRGELPATLRAGVQLPPGVQPPPDVKLIPKGRPVPAEPDGR